jgi:lipoprotein-anchoring transpeptidase ErfK/SrfK
MSRSPSAAATGIAVALCLAIANACSGSTKAASSHSDPKPPAVSAAHLSINPANGRGRVKPGRPVTVAVQGGRLTSVSLDGGGTHVRGHLVRSTAVWQFRQTLHTATRYTVHATAVDTNGLAVSETSRFRTLRPAQTVDMQIFEGYQQTYGVGMPIILTFDHPVVNKAAVEQALQVRTSKPVVGAWYWDGDTTLYFRPRTYWPADTTVHFVGHLDGVQVAPGVYGAHTLTQSFQIGRSLIAVADTSTHQVQIYLNKRLYGNWPMSSGRPGDDTPNGTYLSIEKHNPEEMIGPGYDIEVPWSVRFTWSGDYLHDAFWSVGQQGFENVSHGCINLSPEHAKAYYQLSVPGDPVTVTGSPRGGVWGNGWTVWFLSWRDLVKGSAVHQAVRTGPSGSTFVNWRSVRRDGARPPLQAPAADNALAA